MLVALVAGCGEVHFVPSPYTPQAVELVYSPQEHITVMRWRVSAALPVAETRFEMLGADGGYQPIDFSQSAFPGGLIACTDKFGTCAQYVVRGQYTVPPDARPVQAVHDVYGVLPGGVPTYRTASPSLELASFFHGRNQTVTLNITDHVAKDGPYDFPRSFDRAMWPTVGLCIGDTAPDDVSFSPLDATSGFPPETPLTDAGTYCVATRPVPSDGGDSTMVQVKIETLPETVSATQIYEPPIEKSPIIYQIILDLEIPAANADICADLIQKLENLTAKYLVAGGVPVHKLPTINLGVHGSEQCAQTNDRIVDSAGVANQIKQLITTLGGKHQQVHLMYFNNLDAPLPQPLVTSLRSLFDALAVPPPGYELETFSWIFNPGIAYLTSNATLNWLFDWVWETVDDMFAMALADYGRKTLPITTQEHDPYEPVKLLSSSELATYADTGASVKICSSSQGVQPIATVPFQHTIIDPSWKITSADPPAYLVMLDNQITVAGSLFVEQSAIVNYQVCTRYCDGHGFVDNAGRPQTSWSETTACAGRDN